MAEQVATSKDINELTKAIRYLTTPLTNMFKNQPTQTGQAPLQTVGTDGTSKFMKKEDTAKRYYKESITTLKDILKTNKEMLKNSLLKIGGGLGSLLAGGGLLAYLLTGKTDFLNTAIKGLEKAFILPVAKMLDKTLGLTLGNIGKLSKNILQTTKSISRGLIEKSGELITRVGMKIMDVPKLKKIGTSVANFGMKVMDVPKKKIGETVAKVGMKGLEALGKGSKTLLKKGIDFGLKNIFGNGLDVLKYSADILLKRVKSIVVPLSKMITTGTKPLFKFAETLAMPFLKVAGVGGKILGKGGKLGLKALAKIPILGTILGPVVGIIFAMQKWKKGDYVGALGEMASGLASMIPGFGIPISLAIDAWLMFRDFKKPEDIAAQNKGKIGKVGKAIDKTALEKIPVFGTLIHYKKMVDNWKKKDYLGSFKEAGLAFGGLIPGFEMSVGLVKNIMSAFSGKDIEESDVQGMGVTKNVDYEKIIAEQSKLHPNLPPSMMRSMLEQESSMGKNAKDVYTGEKWGYARGPAQFIDATAQRYIKDWKGPEDSRDPNKAIAGMYDYMEDLLKKKNGDYEKAITSYHGGGTDILGMTSNRYTKEVVQRMGGALPTYQSNLNPKLVDPSKMNIKVELPSNVINSNAIDPSKYMQNISKLSDTTNKNNKELIEAIKEGNNLLVKSIQGIKITNKQSVSVNSSS